MGRLPDTFAQRRIMSREPWVMEGDKILTSAQSGIQYGEGVFIHASPYPFEIHRMIPRVICTDANNIVIDESENRSNEFLLNLIRITINDLGKTMLMTKDGPRLSNLVKGTAETTWEFAEPTYLAKGEAFQISLDSDTFPTAFDDDDIAGLRVQISFEGFQLILAPPQ